MNLSKNINIINLFHDEYNLGGIHLFHISFFLKLNDVESNNEIFNKK